MKKRTQDSAEIVGAIREGNVEKVKALLDSGSLLFRKGRITELRQNIPQTYEIDGEEYTVHVDAFSFALSEGQMEVVKLLIDSGIVDMKPDAPYQVIRSGRPELFAYMLEKGMRIDKNEREITRLFLNLMDVWDDAWLPIVKRMELPMKEYGGEALCHAARSNHRAVAEFLLSEGVSVNSRDDYQNTPVLWAVKGTHFEMARLFVENGADLTLKDQTGIRPYIAARSNNNAKLAAYIKAHEPAELYSDAAQDRLFEAYHVPKAMAEYLKHGNLRLEFPEEKSVGWVKLFSYLDVPEVSCQGKKGLALVEDSEDFEVMLIWEPSSRKIWFLDIEHDVFHPLCTWTKFIKDAGWYINRAVKWEFD